MNDLIDLSLIYQDVDPLQFSIQLAAAIALSFILRFYYQRYAAPLGNLGNIGNVLPPLALITFLVIMVVKASLALSLGLVGALSIVRFRAPIKDPMELTYIFMAIAIGLGAGAGKQVITAVVILAIIFVDVLRIRLSTREQLSRTLLIDAPGSDSSDKLDQILTLFNQRINSVRFSRVEVGEQHLSLVADLDNVSDSDIQAIMNDVRALDTNANCTLFDSKPVW